MERSGIADLPLHGGSVPKWLADRMTRLGTAVVESVVHHYGASALISRLADPFRFQALGSVMGMDWHSSGITPSVQAVEHSHAPSADFAKTVARDRSISDSLGGRTAGSKPDHSARPTGQLPLF